MTGRPPGRFPGRCDALSIGRHKTDMFGSGVESSAASILPVEHDAILLLGWKGTTMNLFSVTRRLVLAGAAALPLLTVGQFAIAAETIRFAVTDIAGLEDLQREYGAFRDTLAQATGYEIEFTAVSSRTAAVEAMRAKQIDFVLTGPAEYVVFKKRSEAKVVVGFQRPDYFAMMVTLADSPVQSVSDLKGKKVAFGDIGSTSQHLGPMQLLADFGINPLADIEALHVNRNVAVESLIKGDIAAIGM